MSTPAPFPHMPNPSSNGNPHPQPGMARPIDANHQPAPRLRVSDQDRQRALEGLGSHFAEGRLRLDEYEERAGKAAAAQTTDQLNELFVDLPALKPDAPLMPVYFASEVERARINGSRPKMGIMLLTVIGSIAGASILNPFWAHSAILLFFIPLVATLLYVLKVGPDHWHVPSQQSIERARLRNMRIEQRVQAQELRAQRRQQRAELTSNAMDIANRGLQRFQGPRR